MMMMANGFGRASKLVIGLMLAMIGAHLVIFALAAAGVVRGSFGSSGGLWGLLMLIPIAVIILMLVFGRRQMMHQPLPSNATGSPAEILQQRFARGEITKDQYEEMEHVLREHAPDR